MTIGILKNNSLVAITKEVTQGTLVPPTLGGEFIQPLEDGFEITPMKELLERTILTTNIGTPAGLTSMESVEGSLPVEFKSSGTAGQEPQYGLLIESALGAKKTVATETTTALGTTTTFTSLATALVPGDFIVLQMPGETHAAFVKSVLADVVTFTPASTTPIPSGTVITASVVYSPTNINQPTFSAYFYEGNETLITGAGCRTSSMAIENFIVGQIPNLTFGFQGLDFNRTDVSNAIAPIFQSNMPPVVLGATLANGGDCIKINEFGMSLENTLGFIQTVCSASGKISSMISSRGITGTMNPYMDDASLEWFQKFDSNALFELTLTLGIPSAAVPGEIVSGSIVGIYLPNVLITELGVGDIDGILTEAISFQATTGAAGDKVDIYMGFA